MTCVSYSVLSGSASTSFSFSSASGYFLASAASFAAFSGLEALPLTFLSLPLSLSCFLVSLSPGCASSCATAPALAPRRIALAATAASSLAVTFMLVPELRGVHEPDLLHAIALGSRQHHRHLAVLGPAIGTQMDFLLRIAASFRAKVLLESTQVVHDRSVPHHRAVEVHFEVDHLRADFRRR